MVQNVIILPLESQRNRSPPPNYFYPISLSLSLSHTLLNKKWWIVGEKLWVVAVSWKMVVVRRFVMVVVVGGD